MARLIQGSEVEIATRAKILGSKLKATADSKSSRRAFGVPSKTNGRNPGEGARPDGYQLEKLNFADASANVGLGACHEG
jgi:hypothetical protein